MTCGSTHGRDGAGSSLSRRTIGRSHHRRSTADSSAAASAAPDVMVDPVDELIEHVIRSGGSAEFVAPNALVGLGRIGLLLR